MIYVRTSKLPNLVGFAYVSKHRLSLTSAQLETVFLKKAHYMGRNLEDAIQWGQWDNQKRGIFGFALKMCPLYGIHFINLPPVF